MCTYIHTDIHTLTTSSKSFIYAATPCSPMCLSSSSFPPPPCMGRPTHSHTHTRIHKHSATHHPTIPSISLPTPMPTTTTSSPTNTHTHTSIKRISQAIAATEPSPLFFLAFASFSATGETEISFDAGDKIKVLNQEHPKWWYGQKEDGQEVCIYMWVYVCVCV